MSVLRPVLIEYSPFLVKRCKYSSPRIRCKYIELSTFQPCFLGKTHGAFETTGIISIKSKNEETMYPDAGGMQFFNNALVFVYGIYFFPYKR